MIHPDTIIQHLRARELADNDGHGESKYDDSHDDHQTTKYPTKVGSRCNITVANRGYSNHCPPAALGTNQ